MGIVCRHAGHAMTKERLADFVIHTDTLESGREGMPEVVKVQSVNPTRRQVSLQYSLMPLANPMAEHPPIGD